MPPSPKKLLIRGLAIAFLAIVLMATGCSAESTITTSQAASDESASDESAANESASNESVSEAVPTLEPVTESDGDVDLAELQPGDVVVRLLDAGSEPRQLLRIDLAPSCAELMIVDQTQELTQQLGALDLPSPGPVQSIMTLRLTSTRLSAESYEVTGEIVSALAGPDTDPATAAAMNTQFTALEGVRTISQITDRALPIPGTARTEGTEALGPLGEMMDSINAQLASPLPEEAVGVGASWEVINLLELQGLPVTSRTVLTVESIEGSIVTVNAITTQSVPVGAEMVVPGLTAEVLEWDNTSSGTSTIDLQSLVPVESSATVDAFQSFATDDVGGRLDQEIMMQMEIAGELEDGCAPRPGRARP